MTIGTLAFGVTIISAIAAGSARETIGTLVDPGGATVANSRLGPVSPGVAGQGFRARLPTGPET
jgi:hypothetical protein